MEMKFEKGREGENHISKALTEIGFKVIHIGGAVKYTIDGTKFFCADLLSYGNEQCFWVQCKNKEPRVVYPDTGLELWRFQELKKLQQESNVKVLLLFTDSSQRIYGDWIDNLKETGNHGNIFNSVENCKMIYFWLSDLQDLTKLVS